MNVEIFDEFNEPLKKKWLKFENFFSFTPFHSYAWLSHWYFKVGSPLLSIKPQIVHIYDKVKTYAILPLCIRKKNGIKILEWMGGVNTDYKGVILNKEFYDQSLNIDLWMFINSKLAYYDIILLQNQTQNTIQFFDYLGVQSYSKKHAMTYQARLPNTWDEYYNTINKRLRADSRRQMRRLGEVGKLKFVFSKSEEEKEKIINSMISQKSNRYLKTGVWNMFGLKEYKDFYKGLINFNSNNCKTHITSLLIDKKIIATHVGLVNNNIFYYLMPSHLDSEWGKYSPGRLLLIELIKWSINNGITIFDFTIGEDTYKKDWCNMNEELYEIFSPISKKGYLLSFYIKIISYIKNNLWIKNKARKIRSRLLRFKLEEN